MAPRCYHHTTLRPAAWQPVSVVKDDTTREPTGSHLGTVRSIGGIQHSTDCQRTSSTNTRSECNKKTKTKTKITDVKTLKNKNEPNCASYWWNFYSHKTQLLIILNCFTHYYFKSRKKQKVIAFWKSHLVLSDMKTQKVFTLHY